MKKPGMVWVPLLALITGLALADGGNGRGEDNHHAWGHDHETLAAPEIDPGEAMGALVMLGGAVAILRGYRRKK